MMNGASAATAGAQAPAPPVRIYAGKQRDFLNDARQLVKHGIRNIAVVLHDGRFFAFDNACYHHGGALLRGDIEDMGGHPCIVCPWHSYRIAMDTGEGLYIGIEVDTAGSGAGKLKQAVKSKGRKQRVYPVTVEADGSVFVEYDTSGPRVDSDTYANMAIANQEEATSTPISGGGGQGRGPRLHSGRGMELRSGHVFQGLHAGRGQGEVLDGSGLAGGRGRGLGSVVHTRHGSLRVVGRAGMNPLAGPPTAAPIPVSSHDRRAGTRENEEADCTEARKGDAVVRRGSTPQENGPHTGLTVSCTLVEDVCVGVKQFSFACRGGAIQRHCELGEYVELELPVNGPDGRRLRRKWTVSAVNHRNTVFTIIVKSASTDTARSGSAWLHQYALHTLLPVCRIGGTFTMVDHAQRIRECHGQVLWLTAGIGITSAYASVVATLRDGYFVYSTTEPLRLLHMHVDRHADGVAKLGELVGLAKRFPSSASSSRAATMAHIGGGGGEDEERVEERTTEAPATTKSYTLKLFLTKDVAPEQLSIAGRSDAIGGSKKKSTQEEELARDAVEKELSRAPNAILYGRRLGHEDIVEGVREMYPLVSSDTVCFVCGPPAFIDLCTSALLSLGVAEDDILTDDP